MQQCLFIRLHLVVIVGMASLVFNFFEQLNRECFTLELLYQ